jgi:hypothetical protein
MNRSQQDTSRPTAPARPRAEGRRPGPARAATRPRRAAPLALLLTACLGGSLLSGCAAVSNPVASAIPAPLVPPAFLAKPREGTKTIPLNLLGQAAPDVYRLAPGDTLGVWVRGIIPDLNQLVPAHVSPPVRIRDQVRLTPSLGLPVTVREDGAIPLPLINPVPVLGMTLREAEAAILRAYTVPKKLLKDPATVAVTLMQGRTYQVHVLRQESPAFLASLDGRADSPSAKRGTGTELNLPAYQNDVLHVLTQTTGLPGLDACNEVIIFRNCFQGLPAAQVAAARAAALQRLSAVAPGGDPHAALGIPSAQVVRIPLRWPAGKPLPFSPQDVILQNGDVVFIESRDREVFYTGGLMPPGEYLLPRDYDLDVVTAILRVRGPLVNGAFSTSNLSGNLINTTGLGNPNPDLVTVMRCIPGYGRLPIRVELRRAMRDPRENLLVKAGDVLILQETPGQAVARYLYQSFFNFNFIWEPIHSPHSAGFINVAAPDRLSGSAPFVTFTPGAAAATAVPGVNVAPPVP